MPEIKISALSGFTGDPTGSWLIINKGNPETTYKIQRESFLSGFSGGSNGTSGISGSSGSSGISGTSGTSGISGSSGSSGISGSSGSSGISGTSGSSGISGSSGTSGSNGTDGTSGSNGTDGSSGTSGSNGTDGTSGSNGTDGTSGSNGTDGSSGSNGTDGSSGTSGDSLFAETGSYWYTKNNIQIDGTLTAKEYYVTLISSSVMFVSGSNNFGDTLDDNHNFTGSVNITGSLIINGTSYTAATSGTSGSNGTDGSSGSSGSNGTDGSSGSSGSNGTDGSSGSNGTDGTSGSNGTDGSSGTSGSNGTDGSSGSSGSNGTDGTSGSNGTDGSSGTSGSNGTDGSSGTSGINGTSGSNGTNGSSGTSGDSIFALTGSVWETSKELKVNNNLSIDGILTAREIHMDYVTSSVLYTSGSNKFGNTFDDTHNFTGSVFITGSLVIGETSTSIPLEIRTTSTTGTTPSVKTIVQQQTGIVLTNDSSTYKIFTTPVANLIKIDYWFKNTSLGNGRGGMLLIPYDSGQVAPYDYTTNQFLNIYSGVFFDVVVNGSNIEVYLGLYDDVNNPNDELYTENITIILNATIITTA
jgi:hypothetical protein